MRQAHKQRQRQDGDYVLEKAHASGGIFLRPRGFCYWAEPLEKNVLFSIVIMKSVPLNVLAKVQDL